MTKSVFVVLVECRSTGSACDQCCRAVCLRARSDPALPGSGHSGIRERSAICSHLLFSSPNLAVEALVPQQLNLMLDWFLSCHFEPEHGSSTAELLAGGDECWAWGNHFLGWPQMGCAEGPALP